MCFFRKNTSQKNSFPRRPQNQDIQETSSELLIVESSSSSTCSSSDVLEDDVDEVRDDSDEVFLFAFFTAVLCSNDSDCWLLCDLFAWLCCCWTLTDLFNNVKLFSFSRLNSDVSEPLWLSTWLLLTAVVAFCVVFFVFLIGFNAAELRSVAAFCRCFSSGELIFEAVDVLN